MDKILAAIRKADANVIETIMKAVLQRYAKLFPEWEISVISLEKSKDRGEQLEKMIATLESLKMNSKK